LEGALSHPDVHLDQRIGRDQHQGEVTGEFDDRIVVVLCLGVVDFRVDVQISGDRIFVRVQLRARNYGFLSV
jgi:hypothetical protein